MEIEQNIKRIYKYKQNAVEGTQFRDACEIAICALLKLKEIYEKVHIKTAITQLADEIDKMIEITENNSIERFHLEVLRKTVMKPYFDIEKQQIKQAWLSAWKDSFLKPLEDRYYEPQAEDYYNETYPKSFEKTYAGGKNF